MLTTNMSTDIGRIATKRSEQSQRAILVSNAYFAGTLWIAANEGEGRRTGLVVEQ
jgi:hypothetical protein